MYLNNQFTQYKLRKILTEAVGMLKQLNRFTIIALKSAN